MTIVLLGEESDFPHPLNTSYATLIPRVMSTTQRYKARFNTRLPNGDFLWVTVWPGKSDPNAEVINIQIHHQENDTWETTGRIAIYRTSDGRFLLLPEKQAMPTPAKAETVEIGASGESYE